MNEYPGLSLIVNSLIMVKKVIYRLLLFFALKAIA